MTDVDTVVKDRTVRVFRSLPFEPLETLARQQAGIPLGFSGFSTAVDSYTSIMFAKDVGFNQRAIVRWKERGTIPWISADMAACHLGFHPMSVWGDVWLNLWDDYDKIASGKYDVEIERSLNSMRIKKTFIPS